MHELFLFSSGERLLLTVTLCLHQMFFASFQSSATLIDCTAVPGLNAFSDGGPQLLLMCCFHHKTAVDKEILCNINLYWRNSRPNQTNSTGKSNINLPYRLPSQTVFSETLYNSIQVLHPITSAVPFPKLPASAAHHLSLSFRAATSF